MTAIEKIQTVITPLNSVEKINEIIDQVNNLETDKFATTEFVLDNCYKPPLLSFMWSDHLLNDISWLRADTFSWQDGTTYSLIYNELLSEYNNSASVEETEGSITFKRTPKGYKIALATQETAIAEKYATDGIAWYYILDSANKKFKLPRTSYNAYSKTIPVRGNGNALGIIDGTNEAYLNQAMNGASHNEYGLRAAKESDGSIPIPGKTGGISIEHDGMYWGINTNSEKSGIIASSVSDEDKHLYFYVGEFTESAESQTAGLNSELFNGKVDLNFNNMNPSQTAKNTIVGWGMPDYSARIICGSVIATTLTYECPSKGWVSPDFVSFNGAGYFAINGIKIQDRTTGNQYMLSHVGLYPVEAGDVVTARSTYTSAGYLSMNVYFYPCKGV